MILAKVTGTLVATQKSEELEGQKLLIVQQVSPSERSDREADSGSRYGAGRSRRYRIDNRRRRVSGNNA